MKIGGNNPLEIEFLNKYDEIMNETNSNDLGSIVHKTYITLSEKYKNDTDILSKLEKIYQETMDQIFTDEYTETLTLMTSNSKDTDLVSSIVHKTYITLAKKYKNNTYILSKLEKKYQEMIDDIIPDDFETTFSHMRNSNPDELESTILDKTTIALAEKY